MKSGPVGFVGLWLAVWFQELLQDFVITAAFAQACCKKVAVLFGPKLLNPRRCVFLNSSNVVYRFISRGNDLLYYSLNCLNSKPCNPNPKGPKDLIIGYSGLW